MYEVLAANEKTEKDVEKTLKELPNHNFGYSKVQNVFNTAYAFAGLVAVAFIIYGAVTYVTSAGNAAKIQKAKNAILWAVVGLIVVLLAAAITWFVISNINSAG